MPKHPVILLTGGRGRLAASIRESLNASGFAVRSFSRTAGEGFFSLDELLRPGLREDAHAIIHTAWSTVPVLSEREPACEWEHDLPLLARLLRHFNTPGRVRPPHFIFCSSGGTVYGDAMDGRASDENSALRPKGWHGLAKIQAETLVREACARFGMPGTILRISNPYGIHGNTTRPQGIIPLLIQRAMDGDPFVLWGDGTAEKDFLHIDDFNEAMLRVVRQRPLGTFNLGYGQSHTINTVIAHISELTGQAIQVVRQPAKPWDVTASRLDCSAFRDACSWAPTVPLELGLRLCMETSLNNV